MAETAINTKAIDTSRPKNDEEWLKERVKEFERIARAEAENREQGLDDLKFKAGDQWPVKIKSDREADGRPCLTVNMIPTFVNQVVNPIKESRPGIKLRPRGSISSKKSSEIFQGMIRQIEYDCHADAAYDIGYESAVDIGWGYWRICTAYEKDDSFNQIIQIKPIHNTMTVYMDDKHRMPDGSDSKFCFVTDNLSKEVFKKKYPTASPMHWQTNAQGDQSKAWVDAETVRVCEYYWHDHEEKELVQMQNGWIGFKSDYKGPDQEIVQRRMVKVRKIMWRRFTFYEILEEQEWPGYCIPIVKVIGNSVPKDGGQPVLSGVIRSAKDPQRMYNYWTSAETENIALQPRAPWIAAEGQLENYQEQWKTANRKNHSVLLYRPMAHGGKPVPPPQRQAPPPVAQGIVTAKMGAREDLKQTTGIYDPSLGVQTNERTGRAIQARQGQAEIGHFHFPDNLCKSLMYTGVILIDLIPKIYDTPRMVAIMNEAGETDRAMIDVYAKKAYMGSSESGLKFPVMNPKKGEYDVIVTTGPSYQTKRMEAANSMMEFIRAVPQAGQIIGDLIAKNMDWPGAEEVATRLAKALPPKMLTPENDTPPQAQAMIAGLQDQIKQMMQGMMQMQKALQDKKADQELTLFKILEDYETKMAKLQTQSTNMVEDRFGKLLDTIISHQSASDDRHARLTESMAKMAIDMQMKHLDMQNKVNEVRDNVQKVGAKKKVTYTRRDGSTASAQIE